MTQNKIFGIIIMKDERVWDFSQCQIGHPCDACVNTCSFKITYSLVEGQDEKEKNDERIFKCSKE